MTKKPISTELAELFDLLNSGAITKEEYDSLKKQILTKDRLDNTENETEEVPDYNTTDDSLQSKKSNRIWLYAIASVVFIFIIFMLLKTFAFSSKPDNNSSMSDTTLNVSSELESNPLNKSANFYIKSGSVGDILIDNKVSQIPKEFSINKKVEIISGEQGEYEQTYFEILKGSDLLCRLEQDGKGGTINEIIVISPNCKTEKYIGIGSTIKKFSEIYPDFKLWCSYESGGSIWIETNTLKNVQFIIDIPGFNCEGYMQQLKFSDVKPDSKIISIRLWTSSY